MSGQTLNESEGGCFPEWPQRSQLFVGIFPVLRVPARSIWFRKTLLIWTDQAGSMVPRSLILVQRSDGTYHMQIYNEEIKVLSLTILWFYSYECLQWVRVTHVKKDNSVMRTSSKSVFLKNIFVPKASKRDIELARTVQPYNADSDVYVLLLV